MDKKQSESVACAATGRRGFIGGMLAAGAAPVIVPATVLGKDAPSNKITLGVIGLGARARTVVPSLVGLPNVRLVVMADCNLRRVRVEDNIKLPLVLAGESHTTMDDKVLPLVKELGIADLIHKYPYEVSGGQKQRTAVARALITKPQILLADEPTGALDSKAATNLMHQLRDIHKSGQTILMVTHSNVAASYADRVMFIRDGEVFHQIYRGNLKRSEMLDKICDAVTVLMRGGEDSE